MAVTMRTADRMIGLWHDLYCVQTRLKAEGFDRAASDMTDAMSAVRRVAREIQTECTSRNDS